MTALTMGATALPDDSSRQALRRLTLMMLAGLGFTLMIVGVLVFAALQAVAVIDRAGGEREVTQVERSIAAYGGDLNYVTLDAMRQTLDLDNPRLVAASDVKPSELSVPLGGDRVVAWTPHLFGQLTFGQLAPTRIAVGLCFVLMVGLIALRVRHVGRQLEQKRQEATQLALTDSLTGLGNRLAFEAALAARFARHERFTLILADLDRFKSINDQFGHAAGDQVLKQVANSLRGSGKVEAARLGGDEFAVLCAVNDLDDYLSAVRRQFDDPLDIDGNDVRLGLSFGVARSADFEPTADALLRAADAALYRAKRHGGSSAELANPLAPNRRYAA
jgi:diguanylate cyclase (GGDEF)-like protein